MTRDQAIQKLGNGLKISHRFFLPYEYIYMIGKMIFDESDTEVGFIDSEFMAFRKGDKWNDGWFEKEFKNTSEYCSYCGKSSCNSNC